MAILHTIKRAVVDYGPSGQVVNVHVEGETPVQYSDGSAAPPQQFGVDFDSGTFGLKWQTLYPTDDSAGIAVKQFNVLGQVVADKLAAG